MTLRLLATALALMVACPVFAQEAPSRAWVDFNFVSVHSQQDAQTYTLTSQIYDETASAASAYPALPAARGGDLGGGVRVSRNIGVGIHFSMASYESPVGLALNFPHPFFFNRFASDADTTHSALERRDRSLDFSMMYDLPISSDWRIRLFGGPSYFTIKQEMVEGIEFDQDFSLAGVNVVDITSFTQRDVDDSAWGFNVGVDVAYFFSRHVGIGGVLRFNRATVNVEEPLTTERVQLEAGATGVGAGIRFRF